MSKKNMTVPLWAMGRHFTYEQMERLNNSPYSRVVLTEAARILGQQRRDNALLRRVVRSGRQKQR